MLIITLVVLAVVLFFSVLSRKATPSGYEHLELTQQLYSYYKGKMGVGQ